MMTTKELQPHHRADLQKSGLSDQTIAEAGLYSATAEQVRKILNRDAGPGLAIPYPPLAGTSEFIRVKPDTPPAAKVKYLTRQGAGNRLYVPPTVGEVLQNTQIPLLVTEGEKKALKAIQEGFPCVALAGVWNFREKYTDKQGKTRRRLLPDFQHIEWEGRQVYIVYDSDAVENATVLKAEYALGQVLTRFNADVRVVRLPGDTEFGT